MAAASDATPTTALDCGVSFNVGAGALPSNTRQPESGGENSDVCGSLDLVAVLFFSAVP